MFGGTSQKFGTRGSVVSIACNTGCFLTRSKDAPENAIEIGHPNNLISTEHVGFPLDNQMLKVIKLTDVARNNSGSLHAALWCPQPDRRC